MKLIQICIAAFLACSILYVSSSAKEWCGIVPLKSTRADVERVLGPESRERLPAYYLPGEIVYVEFAANPGCREHLARETWNVPKDTVTLVHRFLKKPVPLSRIDLRKFRKVKRTFDVEGQFSYVNDTEGFVIEFDSLPDGKGDFVTGYIYAPKAVDRDLRCPGKKNTALVESGSTLKPLTSFKSF